MFNLENWHNRDLSRDSLFVPLEQEFNQFFDSVFGKSVLRGQPGYPRMDVYETKENKWVVEMALAGIDPNSINVEVTRQEDRMVLKVSGSMGQEFQHNPNANYLVKELSRKSFQRQINLHKWIKTDPEAVFKNGMLTLTWDIPEKLEVQQTKSIPIKVMDAQPELTNTDQ